MLDDELPLDQEAVVLGIEDGPLDLVAGKAADRVARLPEGEGDELRPLPGLPPQNPGAAVPGVARYSARPAERR